MNLFKKYNLLKTLLILAIFCSPIVTEAAEGGEAARPTEERAAKRRRVSSNAEKRKRPTDPSKKRKKSRTRKSYPPQALGKESKTRWKHYETYKIKFPSNEEPSTPKMWQTIAEATRKKMGFGSKTLAPIALDPREEAQQHLDTWIKSIEALIYENTSQELAKKGTKKIFCNLVYLASNPYNFDKTVNQRAQRIIQEIICKKRLAKLSRGKKWLKKDSSYEFETMELCVLVAEYIPELEIVACERLQQTKILEKQLKEDIGELFRQRLFSCTSPQVRELFYQAIFSRRAITEDEILKIIPCLYQQPCEKRLFDLLIEKANLQGKREDICLLLKKTVQFYKTLSRINEQEKFEFYQRVFQDPVLFVAFLSCCNRHCHTHELIKFSCKDRLPSLKEKTKSIYFVCFCLNSLTAKEFQEKTSFSPYSTNTSLYMYIKLLTENYLTASPCEKRMIYSTMIHVSKQELLQEYCETRELIRRFLNNDEYFLSMRTEALRFLDRGEIGFYNTEKTYAFVRDCCYHQILFLLKRGGLPSTLDSTAKRFFRTVRVRWKEIKAHLKVPCLQTKVIDSYYKARVSELLPSDLIINVLTGSDQQQVLSLHCAMLIPYIKKIKAQSPEIYDDILNHLFTQMIESGSYKSRTSHFDQAYDSFYRMMHKYVKHIQPSLSTDNLVAFFRLINKFKSTPVEHLDKLYVFYKYTRTELARLITTPAQQLAFLEGFIPTFRANPVISAQIHLDIYRLLRSKPLAAFGREDLGQAVKHLQLAAQQGNNEAKKEFRALRRSALNPSRLASQAATYRPHVDGSAHYTLPDKVGEEPDALPAEPVDINLAKVLEIVDLMDFKNDKSPTYQDPQNISRVLRLQDQSQVSPDNFVAYLKRFVEVKFSKYLVGERPVLGISPETLRTLRIKLKIVLKEILKLEPRDTIISFINLLDDVNACTTREQSGIERAYNLIACKCLEVGDYESPEEEFVKRYLRNRLRSLRQEIVETRMSKEVHQAHWIKAVIGKEIGIVRQDAAFNPDIDVIPVRNRNRSIKGKQQLLSEFSWYYTPSVMVAYIHRHLTELSSIVATYDRAVIERTISPQEQARKKQAVEENKTLLNYLYQVGTTDASIESHVLIDESKDDGTFFKEEGIKKLLTYFAYIRPIADRSTEVPPLIYGKYQHQPVTRIYLNRETIDRYILLVLPHTDHNGAFRAFDQSLVKNLRSKANVICIQARNLKDIGATVGFSNAIGLHSIVDVIFCGHGNQQQLCFNSRDQADGYLRIGSLATDRLLEFIAEKLVLAARVLLHSCSTGMGADKSLGYYLANKLNRTVFAPNGAVEGLQITLHNLDPLELRIVSPDAPLEMIRFDPRAMDATADGE